MGQKTILTPVQRKFLELVVLEPYILKNYYWTGGTVLSEFYLHHRDSHDIDLFTENEEVDLENISKFIGIAGTKLGSKKIIHRRFLGLHNFTLFLSDSELKIDFNFYPFPRINKGKYWQKLSVDSFQDIAVNKIHTVSMKPRDRDFVDLYFILKNKDKELSLERLISLAKSKFDWHIDQIQLGENFAKVVTVKDFPKMHIPFDQKEMEKFFLNLAKSLKGQIFKK